MPEQWLTDGGFAKHDQIARLEGPATQVFAPVLAPKDKLRDRYAPLPGDSQALRQWCERMGTEAAKRIYKARAVLLWHVLAHNLKRMKALHFAFPA